MRPSIIASIPLDLLSFTETFGSSEQLILDHWTQWAHNARPGEGERRDQALERLRECLEIQRTTLDLGQLDLTELPSVWPSFIERLNVSYNKLECLPENLPCALETLQANHNHLYQLPEHLPLKLENLQIDHNLLTTLPDSLPPGLVVLNAHQNRLVSLPERLPEGLRDLVVESNCLVQLPKWLPPHMRSLNASDNQLTELPASLPNELEKLFVNSNQLTELPIRLPECLEIICVNNNLLISLPHTLPSQLQNLYVCNNLLIQLPYLLPMNLTLLHVRFNQLEGLPETLPDSLEILDVSNNVLECLPQMLPSRLVVLAASYNQLTCLPEILPLELEVLCINNNQITDLPARIPISLVTMNLLNNPIRTPSDEESSALNYEFSFMDILCLWGNNMDIESWKQIESEENVSVFADFLRILYQGLNSTNEGFKIRVGNWLNYLAQQENKAARETVFLLAHEASDSCVDRASFYFNKMYCSMMENELIKNHSMMATDEIIDIISGLFRLQELEKIAAAEVEERRKTHWQFDEDIEIYLAYQYKLKDVLGLPIYSELQFGEIANIDHLHLLAAINTVEEREKQDFLRYLLLESKAWEAIMCAWNSNKVEKTNEFYLDKLASETFENAVTAALDQHNLPENDIDSHRMVSKKMADDLLCKMRLELLTTYLIEKQAESLILRFDLPKE